MEDSLGNDPCKQYLKAGLPSQLPQGRARNVDVEPPLEERKSLLASLAANGFSPKGQKWRKGSLIKLAFGINLIKRNPQPLPPENPGRMFASLGNFTTSFPGRLGKASAGCRRRATWKNNYNEGNNYICSRSRACKAPCHKILYGVSSLKKPTN